MGYLLTRRREMILAAGGGELVENFVRVGTPQIVDGILTTSATSWITTPQSFDPGSNPWEITIKLNRPSRSGYEIFCQSPGVKLRTAWGSNNTKFYVYGASAAIADGNSQKSVTTGGWRWIKMAFSGSVYDFAVSTDGTTYTWISGGNTPFVDYIPNAYKSSTPIKAGTFALASGTGNEATAAQFDLTETVIKINGTVWWKPYVWRRTTT